MELRGDFAADVRVDLLLFAEEVDRGGFELLAVVFAPVRAVVVRDADDLAPAFRVDPPVLRAEDEPPLWAFGDEVPPFFPAALFLADEALLVLFFAVDEPRPPELFVEVVLPDALLLDELEPPFFEAVERELLPVLFLEADDFEPLVELFFVVLVERDFDPELFFAPPEDLDEPELFFEPLLLLELDEREPVDFLVVAIRIIPPINFWCVVHEPEIAIVVPMGKMYGVKTEGCYSKNGSMSGYMCE